MQTFFSQPAAQTVVCGRVERVCVVVCAVCQFGVNFDGNPNWVLNFDFPKQVLNNARLGIILFQTWHKRCQIHRLWPSKPSMTKHNWWFPGDGILMAKGLRIKKKNSPLQPPSTIHTGIVSFWSRFRRHICIIKYASSLHEGNFIASSAQRSCTSSLNSPQRHLYCANKIDNDLRLSVIE